MLHKMPKGLALRRGQFYYRKRVPKEVQSIIGKTEIWRSLKTDSYKIAERRFHQIVSMVIAEIDNARSIAGLSVDDTLFSPLPDDAGRMTVGCSISQKSSNIASTLGAAYEIYMLDATHNWTPRTRESYETSRRLAISVLGADTPLSNLNRALMRDFIDTIRYLPKNASKRFPKLSAREAALVAKTKGTTDLISAANINVYLGDFSSFLNWAVNEELLVRNPAKGLRLPDSRAKRDKRHAFSSEQLSTIFNAPLYTGCQDGNRGYGIAGNQKPRNARFWVPLLALHSGMRLNEICQLDVTDVRRIDDILCFVVTRSSTVGTNDKQLKTGASDRVIPVHQNLIDCGLMRFVIGRLEEGHTKLFYEIDAGSKGIRAVAFSKWFTQFLRKCGGNRERTSFHSFRHNFRDELRFARIDYDISMRLGGWAADTKTGASENYGDGHAIQTLFDSISKLKFANIEIEHLKVTQSEMTA